MHMPPGSHDMYMKQQLRPQLPKQNHLVGQPGGQNYMSYNVVKKQSMMHGEFAVIQKVASTTACCVSGYNNNNNGAVYRNLSQVSYQQNNVMQTNQPYQNLNRGSNYSGSFPQQSAYQQGGMASMQSQQQYNMSQHSLQPQMAR